MIWYAKNEKAPANKTHDFGVIALLFKTIGKLHGMTLCLSVHLPYLGFSFCRFIIFLSSVM